MTDTVRTLNRVELARRGPFYQLTFVGDGFLYHQVRNMVGTLLEVGAGRLQPDDIEGILKDEAEGMRVPLRPLPVYSFPGCSTLDSRVPRD